MAIPPQVSQAVLAIRHVVQDHGDAGTLIGGPASTPGIVWFGRLLGWSWPASYLQVLEKHDGVCVQDAMVFSFLQSFKAFLIFHDRWHGPNGYWPIASDGCGNYYALSFAMRRPDGECPVVFLEIIQSETEPRETVATTYAEFIISHMAAQCRRVGCTARLA